MEKCDRVPRIADLDPDQWYPASLVCKLICSNRGVGMSMATFHRLRRAGRIKVINRSPVGERAAWYVQGSEVLRYIAGGSEAPCPPVASDSIDRRLESAMRRIKNQGKGKSNA